MSSSNMLLKPSVLNVGTKALVCGSNCAIMKSGIVLYQR